MHELRPADTLPAEFMPDRVAAPPPAAPLPYAGPHAAGRVGESWFGIASCALCGVTFLYDAACGVALTRAQGWDAVGWIAAIVLGTAAGCGLGLVCAVVGVAQSRRGRRWATVGLWLNGTIVIGPLLLFSALSG